MGRLQATFHGQDFSSHVLKWDGLWKEAYTPWDRGGPSMALDDLLSDNNNNNHNNNSSSSRSRSRQHAGLLPESDSQKEKRKTAFVPGCGRGHDVLLLSAWGYDVVGLDYAADATREAIENEKKTGMDEIYRSRGANKGTITWLSGDFFDDGWLREAGRTTFDLIFDYTFFCALPPEARSRWAKRMSQLLAPDIGRLLCLEWPLMKPASTGGPPWGVTAEAYEAHLAHPGERVAYDQEGRPVRVVGDAMQQQEQQQPMVEDGLKRLARFRPRRTHKPGYDSDGNVIDFISVWSH